LRFRWRSQESVNTSADIRRIEFDAIFSAFDSRILLHAQNCHVILLVPASSPRGLSTFARVSGHPCPSRRTAACQKEAQSMDDCTVCATLPGRPAADAAGVTGLKLIGIGECEGVTAIEHYLCERCGTVMVRQLCGCSSEQVWTALT
jgi:hypothetical protein